jgi:hypothetical protein
MKSNRLMSLVLAALLAATVSLAPAGAAAAPPGGSTVDIYVNYTTPDQYGVYNNGSFTATAPLCSLGTERWVFPNEVYACADGSGTFNKSFLTYPGGSSAICSSSPSDCKWSFRGGTGRFANIKGGGVLVSCSSSNAYAPFSCHYRGTVSL